MAVVTITKDNFEAEVLGCKIRLCLTSGQNGVNHVNAVYGL